MKEELLTARKDYVCGYCGKPIKKGTRYLCVAGKAGRYNDDGQQVGIQYWNIRKCAGECKIKDDFLSALEGSCL